MHLCPNLQKGTIKEGFRWASSSSLYSTDLNNFVNLPNHLSTIHYNVHNVYNLIAERSYFDIVSLSETWLHDEYSLNELLFPFFYPPERKYRVSLQISTLLTTHLSKIPLVLQWTRTSLM